MSIKNVMKDLKYVGDAEGDSRIYHVFDGVAGYVLLSPSDRGGYNLNIVDHEAPQVIIGKFAGQRVTTTTLSKQSRRPDLFGAAFSPLNSLYVMVALGRARKLKKRDGRSIVFKIR